MCLSVQVIADNDAPELYGPSRYDDTEYNWFALNQLRVHDLDATDRLLPSETVIFCCDTNTTNRDRLPRGISDEQPDSPSSESIQRAKRAAVA